MTDSEIECFIHAFEDCSLPRSEWTHTRHLVMALWYIRRHKRDEATRLIRDGIQRYNQAQGNHTGYHETITKAWIAVIEAFLSKRGRNLPDSVLAGELLHECGDKDYLLWFYTKERLLSDEARSRWLDPDLARIVQPDLAGLTGGDAIVDKVNIREKLALFYDHWSPKVVGELNGQHVKLVKFLGEFVWHKHDHEDELLLVIKGRFRMEFRDCHVWLEEGEFLIVPRGVEHRPVAEDEVHVLLFEPAGTLNTGDVRNERTIRELERL